MLASLTEVIPYLSGWPEKQPDLVPPMVGQRWAVVQTERRSLRSGPRDGLKRCSGSQISTLKNHFPGGSGQRGHTSSLKQQLARKRLVNVPLYVPLTPAASGDRVSLAR